MDGDRAEPIAGAAWRIGRRVIVLARGDITRFSADAIVNAANEHLAGGGGVDGAIHRAAGPGLLRELESRYGRDRRCPVGQAVATGAGALPARWVIHAVGPRWGGGRFGEAAQLAAAYRTSLALADGLGARTVAFPAISCGIYGYPLPEAASIALMTVASSLPGTVGVERATFVLFSDQVFAAFLEVLERLRRPGQPGRA
jgi:O-acetyl-ADP-ribose deacetylase (regulator of RNase III)